jgi:predicted N-acyltransferase
MNANDDPALRVLSAAAELERDQWDACAGADNPFVAHAFFTALEESGSATARTGWQPAHMVAYGPDGRPSGILPAYAKSHSRGEYVFDHSWAEAYTRAGGRYYPKLQISVPFTPATGPRLLIRDESAGPLLLAAARSIVSANQLSGAHATFIEPAQVPLFEGDGWLIRTDQQFHWLNEGYASFQDFLDALASRKRKSIRKERAGALAGGIEVEHLTGDAIREAHWDAFWEFYQDTGARKWGRPYLTRPFFSMLGESMGERVLLVLARRNGRYIAGALNLIGSNALYGRYWGTTEDQPLLHFELCYYQAIDFAIERGLERVEAGAQGEHKLARGYLPTTTYSAHYLADPRLHEAVAEYLVMERRAVAEHGQALAEYAPFRKVEVDGD